jgi:uncharacterized protein (TIGR00106 family)
MNKIIAQVTIVPLGTGSTSLSFYVAEIEKTLNNYPKIKTRLTPMASILEGDFDEVLKAVREMHEVPFQKGALRVSTRISIDDRRDKETSMERKIASVKEKM